MHQCGVGSTYLRIHHQLDSAHIYHAMIFHTTIFQLRFITRTITHHEPVRIVQPQLNRLSLLSTTCAVISLMAGGASFANGKEYMNKYVNVSMLDNIPMRTHQPANLDLTA